MIKTRLIVLLTLLFLPACDDDRQVCPAEPAPALPCFSPTANIQMMWEVCAVGCACDPQTAVEACVTAHPMQCRHGRWEVVMGTVCDWNIDAAVDAPAPQDVPAGDLASDGVDAR